MGLLVSFLSVEGVAYNHMRGIDDTPSVLDYESP